MHKDWPKMAAEISALMKEVRAGVPDVAKGFSQMAAAATAAGALDTRSKELIALAISIAVRCDGCIAFHAKAAAAAGATRAEVMETVGMAMYMGGGPSFVYGAQALEAFDQFASVPAE